MKIIAQGDPVEYDVRDATQACMLYRQDMTKALIGVVTKTTDHERAQRANREIGRLREQIGRARELLLRAGKELDGETRALIFEELQRQATEDEAQASRERGVIVQVF